MTHEFNVRVTLEGRPGSGKTKIGLALAEWARENGLTICWEQDCTPKGVNLLRPNIVLVEKQAKGAWE